MDHYLIIPGLGNSGPEHWQTWFETTGDHFTRVMQKEWDAPLCEEWIATIDKAVSAYDPSTVIMIGHSLGCLTIVHWANTYKKKIKGALLVAPSDAEADVYTFPAKGFSPVPLKRLDFKSVVVASSNDVWVSLERATYFAACWGSELVNIGEAGHINSASGHYRWTGGLELLKRF